MYSGQKENFTFWNILIICLKQSTPYMNIFHWRSMGKFWCSLSIHLSVHLSHNLSLRISFPRNILS